MDKVEVGAKGLSVAVGGDVEVNSGVGVEDGVGDNVTIAVGVVEGVGEDNVISIRSARIQPCSYAVSESVTFAQSPCLPITGITAP